MNYTNESELKGLINQIFDICSLSGGWGDALRQLFGNVVCSVDATGADITVLTYALGFVNIIALALGIIIVSYVTIGGALNTASQGEMLGKSWSTVWLPIRVAIGFGMLMPVGNGGLSSVQNTIIGISVAGVNAGNLLYDKVVDRITEGAPLVANSKEEDVNTDDVAKQLKMMMCAEDLYQSNNGQDWEGAYTVRYRTGLFAYKEHKGSIKDFDFSSALGAKEIQFGYLPKKNGVCGTQKMMEYEREVHTKEYEDLAKKKAYAEINKVIVASLNRQKPMAHALVQPINTKTGKYTSIGGSYAIDGASNSYGNYDANLDINGIHLLKHIRIYGLEIANAVNASVRDNTEIQKMWSTNLKETGLLYAGMWFHELSRYSSLSQSIMNDTANKVSAAESIPCTTGFFNSKKSRCDILDQVSDKMSIVSIIEEKAMEQVNRAPSGNKRLDTAMMGGKKCSFKSGCSIEEWLGNTSNAVAQGIVNIALSEGNSASGNTSTIENDGTLKNPFTMMNSVGHGTINIATKTYLSFIVAAGAAEGVAQSVIGMAGGGILSGALKAIMVPMISMLGLLLASGLTLAYFVPLMPMIAWGMGIIHYLKILVEGVAAAPLAVILMVTPEGEGISGTRLERALQLVFRLFLHVPLMLISLLAAISISYIGFGILNYMFWEVTGANSSWRIVQALTTVTMYSAMGVMVMKKVIEYQNQITEDVMNWMSAGVGQAFGGSDDVGGGVQNIAQASAKGDQAAMKAVSDTAKARRKPRGEND